MSRVHKMMSKDNPNSPGVLWHPNGDYTKSQAEAAKLLLDTHFPGNETPSDEEYANTNWNQILPDEDTINDIVTRDKTLWALSSFDPFKSPGHDEIYPIMLQKAWAMIDNHLKDVFKAHRK